MAGADLTPTVTVQDESGNTVTDSTASITVAIGTNPGSADLNGTVTLNATSGVATWGADQSLDITVAATGYTLTATTTGPISVTSGTFDITAAATAPAPQPGATVTASTGETTSGVTTPTGGTVKTEAPPEEEQLSGYSSLNFTVNIDALDATVVPEGMSTSNLAVFRNGVPVPSCIGAVGVASPDSCVCLRNQNGKVGFTVLTSQASAWTVAVIDNACPEGHAIHRAAAMRAAGGSALPHAA